MVAFYPGPAGATESELPLDAWRADRGRPTRSSACCVPTSRRCCCAAPTGDHAGLDCHLVPIDACYELVGRLRSLWRGFDGGQRGAGRHRRLLRRRRAPSRPAPPADPRRRTGAHVTGYAFSVLDVFAEPYAAAPQLTARLRIEESTGQTVHAIALRCQVRIEPQRRPYERGRRERACAPCSATATGGPTRCGRSCGCSAARWCRASPASPRSTSRCRAPTTSTSPGPATCTRVGDGAVPLALLFSGHRVHQGRAGVRRASRCRGTARRRTGCRSRCGRQMIASYFPNTGWLRLDRDVLDALADFRSEHGLTSWEETVQTLLRRPGRSGVVSARPSLDGVRAVADAVLYEGYLLYPYRASSAKNRSRWQFGVLGPPRASADSFGEEPEHVDAVPAGAGPRRPGDAVAAVRILLRFLHAPGADGRAARRTARWSPTDELVVDGRSAAELGRGRRERAVAAGVRPRRRVRRRHRSARRQHRRRRRAARRSSRSGDHRGTTVGRIVRRRWPLTAVVRRRRRAGRRLRPADRHRRATRTRTRRRQGRRDPAVADRRAPDPDRASRRGFVSLLEPRRRTPPPRRAVPPAPLLAGAGRAGRQPRRRARLADHPLRPPRGRRPEPGRAVRLDRDRRDPHAAGDDA